MTGDEEEMGTALFNVIRNGAEEAKKSSAPTLSFSCQYQDNGSLEAILCNSGTDITEENLAHPNSRSLQRRSSKATSGRGHGLVLFKQTMMANGIEWLYKPNIHSVEGGPGGASLSLKIPKDLLAIEEETTSQ